MIRTAARLALCMALGAVAAGPALAQKVRLATSMGDIVLQLDPEKAPKTAENFTQEVKAGPYEGTIFHHGIDNFMAVNRCAIHRPSMRALRTSSFLRRSFLFVTRTSLAVCIFK